MPLFDHFVELKLLKGHVAVDDVMFEFPPRSATDRRFPLGLIEGRQYLLFLAPGYETQKKLLDPKNRWGVPISQTRGEVLAIVDLAQPEQEAQLYAIKGTKTAAYQGAKFTPAAWKKLRKSNPVDLPRQQQIQQVIENVILKDATTLADVRSYLGVPDEYDKTADSLDYTYYMNLYHDHKEIKNQLVTRIVCEAGPDTSLARVRIEHSWLEVERGESFTSLSLRRLTAAELRQHGLAVVDRRYHR
jgi:hypothetical protein